MRDDIVTILKKFDFLEGEIEEVSFDQIIDKDCYDNYDVEIKETSDVVLYIGDDESPVVPSDD